VNRDLTPIGDEAAFGELVVDPALRAASPWQWAAAATLILTAASILVGVSWRAYIYAPFADAYDWAADALQADRTGGWIKYVWAPHAGQRIPIARIAEALDIEWLKGRAPIFLIAGAASIVAGLSALFLLIWRAQRPSIVKLWISALAGLVLLNVAAGEDLAIPIFSVYLFVTGPALAAIALFHVDPAARLKSPWFWLAIVCAALASCGNAAGFAVWPALLVCAWRQEPAGRRLQVILLACVLCVAGLQVGLGAPIPPANAPTASSGAHLLKMIRYFASFSGLPWSRGVRPLDVGELLGVFIVVVAAILLIRRSGEALRYSDLTGAGRGLIVFGMLAALLASIGRVDEFPLPLAATRYAPFALLLQTGVVLRCVGWLEAVLAHGPKRTAAGVIAVGAALLAAQIHGAAFLLRTASQIQASEADLDAGRSVTGLQLYPDTNKARKVRAQLKERGLPL
jgi:hypothetical protein